VFDSLKRRRILVDLFRKKWQPKEDTPVTDDAVVEGFNSTLIPSYLKRTKSIEEFLPWLYLKGVSTGDFQETLRVLLGDQAKRL